MTLKGDLVRARNRLARAQQYQEIARERLANAEEVMSNAKDAVRDARRDLDFLEALRDHPVS